MIPYVAQQLVDEAKITSEKQEAEDKLALEASKKLNRDLKRKAMRQALSFGEDELNEDEDTALEVEDASQPKKRITKNPDVDTSFLPGNYSID